MRQISLAVVIAGLVASGCSKHTPAATGPQATRYGAVTQAPPDESVWGTAWGGIVDGTQTVARAGSWTLERARDGAIVAWRETKRVAGEAGEGISDAATLAAVKSRLAASPGADAGDINVDVEDGVATLRGRVDSRDEASTAIRVALETRGVDQVVSYLTWPSWSEGG